MVLDPEVPDPTGDLDRSWVQSLVTLPMDPATGQPAMPWEDLAEIVADLRASGALQCFFFVRKPPGLRLRLRGGPRSSGLGALLAERLDRLVATGAVRSHVPAVYEPEVHRFGGAAGMDLAHEILGDDALAAVELERGRCGLDRFVCSGARTMAVLTGACEDRAEVWDVWMRLEALLPPGPATPIDDAWLDLRSESGTEALEGYGRSLRALQQRGALSVGTRSWLTGVTIFQWNQFGLPLRLDRLRGLVASATTRLGPN